jgi:hypothetical protein
MMRILLFVAVLKRQPRAEARFAELIVRANTGLGAEKATTQ